MIGLGGLVDNMPLNVEQRRELLADQAPDRYGRAASRMSWRED
jgi:hypothetical protein